MRKRFILILLGILSIGGIVTTSMPANSNDTGAPSGNTGSPFDNHTCARFGCHPGTATAISNAITSDVPITGYVPGSTYVITASVADPNLVKFGFEISPQTVSGSLLGTITLTDLVHTKFTGTGNKYVTHTLTGTSAPSHSATWSFNWTAPTAGTGNVTFYGAFNFSNNNGQTSGDVIHTSTLVIPEGIAAGIAGNEAKYELNVYPNPLVGNNLGVNYYLSQPSHVRITLIDLAGKKVSQLEDQFEQAGSYQKLFTVDNTMSPGIYILRLEAGDQVFARKVVRE